MALSRRTGRSLAVHHTHHQYAASGIRQPGVIYLAAHVLLCLVPAFFIAGAMTALIPQETITRYLGKDAPKWLSYPMAALGGFVLAVCSCTILPAFRGHLQEGRRPRSGDHVPVRRSGDQHPRRDTIPASLSAWTSPTARVVLSVVFGIGIGLIMAILFAKDDRAHNETTASGRMFCGRGTRQTRDRRLHAAARRVARRRHTRHRPVPRTHTRRSRCPCRARTNCRQRWTCSCPTTRPRDRKGFRSRG